MRCSGSGIQCYFKIHPALPIAESIALMQRRCKLFPIVMILREFSLKLPLLKESSENEAFIDWFHSASPSEYQFCTGSHCPYVFRKHSPEDGNGRMGRVAEKILEGVGQPILIAISKTLKSRKKSTTLPLKSVTELWKCNIG